MTRVTSKLQVTIPKAIAERYGIEPGQEIDWLPAGDAIRVVPEAEGRREPDVARSLELFDRATERQRAREAALEHPQVGTDERGDQDDRGDRGDQDDQDDQDDRGWTREDLYRRGVAG